MKNPYQFARTITASKVRRTRRTSTNHNGNKSRGNGWSAADLAAEAERQSGHCGHVAKPQRPKRIYGCKPSEAAKKAEEWGAQARDAGGRRWAKNCPIMAGEVYSCPRSKIDIWPDLRDSIVADLKTRHGKRLLSVVEHLDEAHPHIHAYLVPKLGEPFGVVHDGYKEKTEATALAKIGELPIFDTPPGKKLRGAGYTISHFYREAMSAWQVGIFHRVYEKFGFDRLGPARKRRNADEQKVHMMFEIAGAKVNEAETLLADAREIHRTETLAATEAKAKLIDENTTAKAEFAASARMIVDWKNTHSGRQLEQLTVAKVEAVDLREQLTVAKGKAAELREQLAKALGKDSLLGDENSEHKTRSQP